MWNPFRQYTRSKGTIVQQIIRTTSQAKSDKRRRLRQFWLDKSALRISKNCKQRQVSRSDFWVDAGNLKMIAICDRVTCYQLNFKRINCKPKQFIQIQFLTYCIV